MVSEYWVQVQSDQCHKEEVYNIYADTEESAHPAYAHCFYKYTIKSWSYFF